VLAAAVQPAPGVAADVLGTGVRLGNIGEGGLACGVLQQAAVGLPLAASPLAPADPACPAAGAVPPQPARSADNASATGARRAGRWANPRSALSIGC
jgi:sugar (pentulose or hexulose) kinase